VLNGWPEHPVTANSINSATATVIKLEAMDRMIDFPSSESISSQC
jgi:hypothetical protein